MAKKKEYEPRITKLLGLVESASTPEEARGYVSKVQEMVTRNVATITMEADEEVDLSTIGSVEVELGGIFAPVNTLIVQAIAKANDCDVIKRIRHYTRPKTYALEIVGQAEDVEWVRALNTSVQLHCSRAVREWVRERDDEYARLTSWEKFTQRRRFRATYADELAESLLKSRRNAEYDVAIGRASGDRRRAAEEIEKVSEALQDRNKRVSARLDDKYGKKRGKRRVAG